MLSRVSPPTGAPHRRYERHPVSCEIDGEVFSGYYWVAGMILVVATPSGGTSRQLADSQPKDLAKILLRDLFLAQREKNGEPQSPS